MNDGRWCLHVEFTFDVKPEDVEHKFIGDAEVDFAARALDRVRPALNGVLRDLEAQNPGATPASWYILQQDNDKPVAPGTQPKITMRRVSS